jgi:hypothetical protein
MNYIANYLAEYLLFANNFCRGIAEMAMPTDSRQEAQVDQCGPLSKNPGVFFLRHRACFACNGFSRERMSAFNEELFALR